MIKCIYEVVKRPYPNATDNKVTISSDGLTVDYGKGYNWIARTNFPIPYTKAKIYNEFTMISTSMTKYKYYCMSFGISNKSGSGYILTAPSISYNFNKNDVIGIAADIINGRVYLSLNGESVSTDEDLTNFIKGEIYYPCFKVDTVYGGYVVQANFGLSPFTYSVPEGYVSLEEAYYRLYEDNELYVY